MITRGSRSKGSPPVTAVPFPLPISSSSLVPLPAPKVNDARTISFGSSDLASSDTSAASSSVDSVVSIEEKESQLEVAKTLLGIR